MSLNLNEADTNTIPKWKVDLVEEYFKQGKVSHDDTDTEFESIFSSSFIASYNGDEAFNKGTASPAQSPQSLKELASQATGVNDSGYEGQNSDVKPRKVLKFKEPKMEEEKVEEMEGGGILGSVLEYLKVYVVVASLLFMVYMTDSSAGTGSVGGKKAAIQFYYDRQY